MQKLQMRLNGLVVREPMSIKLTSASSVRSLAALSTLSNVALVYLLE